MDKEYILTPSGNFTAVDELRHWGIKGMKWGFRRYQNPDGSLTPAGRKRYSNPDGTLNEKGEKYYAKEKARLKAEKERLTNEKRTATKLAKLDKMRKENEDIHNEINGKKTGEVADAQPKTKSTVDMDDKELQDRVNRLRNEEAYRDLNKKLGYGDGPKTELDMRIAQMEKQKRYLELQRDIKNLTPEKVSVGKQIVKKLFDDVVMPAATSAGKSYVEKVFNKATADALQNVATKQATQIEKTVTNSVDRVKNKEAKKEAKREAKAAAKEAKEERKAAERNANDETSAKVVDFITNNLSRKKPTKSEVTEKDYEKEVDKLLAEIDATGWDLYNSKYRRDDD